MIEIVKNPDLDDWQDYCNRCPAALFTHLPGWITNLAATYGLPSFLLLARTSGPQSATAGVLPLLLFSPPDATPRLISLPYTDVAGVLADNQEAGSRLVEVALYLAEEVGAAHLELRQREWPAADVPYRAGDRWRHTAHAFKVSLRRPLPRSSPALWDDLSAKVRNQVRKAYRSGCVGRIGGSELLEDFHAVFAENMRDLGSPTHDFALFRQAILRDSPRARCIVISCRDVPVAGAMVFQHAGTLSNPWAASLRRFRVFCPNMLLYWQMLCHGIEQGCSCFDFGRSSLGTGTCRFKMQWGASVQPLTWHVFSRSPSEWRPENESLVYDDWKSMDISSSIRLGPNIRRWISL